MVKRGAVQKLQHPKCEAHTSMGQVLPQAHPRSQVGRESYRSCPACRPVSSFGDRVRKEGEGSPFPGPLGPPRAKCFTRKTLRSSSLL